MEASRAGRPSRPRKSLRLRRRTADPAFEQLYREHAREVYQYALALLTNPADAEDATQTAFLNAYRAFQRGERPRKPHNWLITITHNVCRMRWREAGSRPREVALEEAPEPAALDHERPDLDAVLTALAELSFNQRAALVMRELEGRTYQEIAEVLEISNSAVEALLFRARRRLQLQRDALGILSTAPLPGSLTSFIGAGGGAVTAGGAAIGANVVLKAAAVVVAGAVTAGVGFKSVEAITTPAPPSAAQSKAPLVGAGQKRARARQAEKARTTGNVRDDKRRRTTPETRIGDQPTAPSNASSATQETSPPLPPIGSTVALPLVGVTVPVPVPPPPALPPLPVTVPPPPPLPPLPPPSPLPPLPPPPPLPITVTTPVLPPPPIK